MVTQGALPAMSTVDRDVPVYPIGVVQKLTGLSGRQIRYYESVGLLTPYRTKGNQRLYSPNDVDLLLEIKRLLAQGLNLDGVKARLREAKERQRREERVEPLAQLSPYERDLIVTQMRAGVKLSSLYPVNNQAELARFLHYRHRSQK